MDCQNWWEVARWSKTGRRREVGSKTGGGGGRLAHKTEGGEMGGWLTKPEELGDSLTKQGEIVGWLTNRGRWEVGSQNRGEVGGYLTKRVRWYLGSQNGGGGGGRLAHKTGDG